MKTTLTALTVIAALGAGVAAAQAESGYKVGGGLEIQAPVNTLLSEGVDFENVVPTGGKF
jgi:hypothetical protein